MKAILVVILLAAAGVIGDFFIKISGSDSKSVDLKWLTLGAVIYLSTIGGWFYAMKHMKLSSLGAVYALTTILLLVAVGIFYFHEKLNAYEIMGIIGAVLSVLLLSRFA